MRWYVIIKNKVLRQRPGSHSKVKQNKIFSPLQDPGSMAVFKVTARGQRSIKGAFGGICYIM